MFIDCDACATRGPACADCVVPVLLGVPTAPADARPELDGAEQAALAVLAGSGLVPPLRLVPVAGPGAGGPPAPGPGRSGDPGRGRAAAG